VSCASQDVHHVFLVLYDLSPDVSGLSLDVPGFFQGLAADIPATS
jgi:hypothetical protein